MRLAQGQIRIIVADHADHHEQILFERFGGCTAGDAGDASDEKAGHPKIAGRIRWKIVLPMIDPGAGVNGANAPDCLARCMETA